MQDLLKVWRNDKSRKEWLSYYRNWDTGYSVDEYHLEFFEFTLPDGRTLIALEHDSKKFVNFSHGEYQYKYDRDVIYYIKKPDVPFVPERWSESAVAGQLMVLKQKLQNGELTDEPN